MYCKCIVSGVTHAVGHAVAHGVYLDIVYVVCHGASHAVNWGSQNFLTLTVQHLLHGNTYHLHISSSTPSVTSTNTTASATITSTNQANVYSEFQLEWMICHTVHMGATSLQYEWANECWCFQSVRMPFCILYSCVNSLHCDGVCAYSTSQPLCMTLHAGHMVETSPHCKWVNEFSDVHNAEFFCTRLCIYIYGFSLTVNDRRSCASSYLQHN